LSSASFDHALRSVGIEAASFWEAVGEKEQAGGASVVAWFEPNLSHQLRYESTLVVLTERYLLAWDRARSAWDRWERTSTRELRKLDRAGLGVIEFIDDRGLIAYWRYTAAQLKAGVSSGSP
jgi:hypothetical protein